MNRSRARAAAIAWAVALAGGCGASAPPPEGLLVDRVRYARGFSTEGAIVVDGALHLTTDRGYTVVLTEASLVDHTLTLVGCDAAASAPTRQVGLWWGPGAWLVGGAVALAGHTVPADVSAVDPVVQADLRAPRVEALGARTFPARRYCGVHWLLGGRGTEVPTLRLAGTWSRGEASGTIDVASAWFQGRLTPLDAVVQPWPAEGGARAVAVTVTHPLGGLLDGVELATATDLEVAWQVLVNLVDHSTVSVVAVAEG
ncbi:MAG: hypothetical protein H6733_09775 [Alphaproteobacteria bacterium]|nr:hypothetical protein [Alphaproteobacteria bacterium]